MIIGDQQTGLVSGVVIAASGDMGLGVTINGKPAQLAVIDENGHTHALGQRVAREAFNVSVNAYRNFLRGEGHLRTLSPPITTE